MTTPKRQTGEDIAIVGMALTVPGADSPDAFWSNLLTGVESIRRLSEDELLAAGESPDRMRRKNYVPAAAVLDGLADFDADFFGFSPKEAAILDPQHRKFMETAWAAMEHAGHPPATLGGRVGVFAGCGMGSYFYFNICSNPDLVNDTGMFLLRHTGNDKDFLSTRVSHLFDLNGPSINLQTACSTSLVAVHYACKALNDGDCDMALAGGVTIELPHGRGYEFKENEILSPDGHCHAFDHRAQGTVFGSGAGTVALRRLSDALRDGDHIWAVIKGSAVNNDGAAKAGYLAPSVDGQASAIRQALERSGVPAETLGYVECHGTGTFLGDPIEVTALTEAWRSQTDATGFARIGSVKTNIGHIDTAAGVAGLIKTALALHHGQIPPSLGYESPNPAIDFDNSPFQVADRLTDWPIAGTRRAAVNALGVGGTNAHAILEQAPTRAASEDSDFPFQILTLSAKSKAALDANAQALANHLRAHPEQPLADIAFTLKEGRAGFDKRRILVAETHEQAIALLESADTRRVFTHDKVADNPGVVFMFPGGGAQYPDMARDLYETEPVFAEWMDRGLDHLAPQLDYDIRALWLTEAGQSEAAATALQKPSVQLPLIMIVEYALAQLWISWGVKPTALVGHSMGENVAACLAGVIGFEDCIDLILLRGRLFDTVPAGGMLSISLSPVALAPLLDDDIDIASTNAPDLTAVSGPQDALDRLAKVLREKDIEFQRIAIDIAAHSRMLDPILSDYRAFLAGIELSAPMLPVISNRTGQPLSDEQATDPDYWVEQLRNTVRFSDCIDYLTREPRRVYLECGPGKALSSLTQMCGASPGQVLSSLRHPDQDMADDAFHFQTLGRLWATGVSIDWPQIWGEARRNRVPLPTYQFQRARYFIEPGKAVAGAESTPLRRADDIADWGWSTVWRPRLAGLDAELENTLVTPLKWLIFLDNTGTGRAVASRLTEAGHMVSTVRSGDTFARLADGDYTLAPERGRDGYDSLFADLADTGRLPDRIAHFWLVTGAEKFRPGSSFFDRNQEHGFYSLMFMAQAMADHEIGPVHVTVMTNGAAQVADEPLLYPEKTMISGPCGVIPRELPGLTLSSLDIDLPVKRRGGDDTLTDRLLTELLSPASAETAALRGAHRFAQTLRATSLPDAPPTFKTGSTWLITGGFGGIGLAMAEHLIDSCDAKIVLVTRRALPARADWARHLRTHAPQDATSRAITALQHLEAKSKNVMVATADVVDVDGMRAAVDAARARFGTITGVIHAAGAIDDGPFLTKDVLSVEAVFAPKINGLRVLDALFPHGTLDTLVLFSSTSTTIRAAGQIDYVAANAYLNGFAKARKGGKTRVISVNWGVWADVGMAANATQEPVIAEQTATAQPLLDTAGFDADGARVFESRFTASERWVLDQHRTKAGDALMPGTGFIEMIAEALAAQEHDGPYEIADLYFLRALDVGEVPRRVQVRLAANEDGLSIVLCSAVDHDGRTGFLTHAEATVLPLNDDAQPLDIAGIRARCRDIRTSDTRLQSPQEAQLQFGPRWHVLQTMAFGEGEGLADLALPDALRGDIDQGYRLHPGLMDLATGWAIELIPEYAPDHLWVPMSFGAIRVHRPLPARVVSWMRLAPGDQMDGFAAFDITITDADGNICVEVFDFAMKRLATSAGFARGTPVAASDLSFDAPRTLSADEERLADTVAMGIRPAEGPVALDRALALASTKGLSQITVSSLPLPALIQAADRAVTVTDTPGQTFDRPQLDSDYVAPRNAVEQTLAGFWQALLGVGQVGVNDSFFDLGGHSLIAVRLFAQINKAFGVQFPISALFESPTIATISERIGAQVGHVTGGAADAGSTAPATDRYDHLVALHQGNGGPKTPMFIVAGMFGNVMNLRHLGLSLGQDRPVYGLQARGLTGDAEPHRTIHEAAAAYIAELRRIQPEGPYLLGGFSGGGITAWDMARQLRAAGDEVAVLALLDTPLPVRPSLTRQDKALIKMQEFRRKGLSYLGEWAKNRVQWEIEKRRAPGPQAEETAFDNAGIEAAFRTAVAQYDLSHWDGPLTLFRPPLDRRWQVSDGAWVSAAREYVLPDNDLTRFAPQTEVIEVPGDHDSMVLVPNVNVLAARLKSVIRAAERVRRSPRTQNRTAAE